MNFFARYPASVLHAITRDWNAFWYTPADPTLLGLIRICTGLMLLYTHAVWGVALDDFYGPTSWLSPSLVRAIEANQYTFSFWFWVPAWALWPAFTVSMVILLLFTFGLFTRVSSVLALYVALSYVHRVPGALFGLDQINIMLTLYLAIGPSGQTLSLDRWLARRRLGCGSPEPAPSISANFAQRLIQVHMCVIYFFAGVAKLQGASWWNGEAMWRAFANLEYQTMDMTWLAWHAWILNAMTHVTILWEVSFCVLIWKPLWRPLVLAMAVVLHVGIGTCLGMWTFGLIMLVGCASFLPNEAVGQIVAVVAGRRSRESDTEEPVPRKDRRKAGRLGRAQTAAAVASANGAARNRS
jgi:hypothetical protein